MPGLTTWRAPVRYAEVDGQGVVFNAHYLLYCDEAMAQFCRDRDLLDLAEVVQLKTSTLTWSSGAAWGETISVAAGCSAVGRTSFTMDFAVSADGRPCCEVRTVYVRVGGDGRPAPLTAAERTGLGSVDLG